MKKKLIVVAAVLLLVIAVLTVPFGGGTYDDGTREYTALTYKVISWDKKFPDAHYRRTRIYFGADRFKSLDRLWAEEENEVVHTFTADVCEVHATTVVVEPCEDSMVHFGGDRVSFGTQDIGVRLNVGDKIKVSYIGQVMCTYPLQVHATAVEMIEHAPPHKAEKPVIYLYPPSSTEVSVEVVTDGRLTCTYPEYNGGWRVTAHPDGRLQDGDGQEYYCLYWEGEISHTACFDSGFCVRGEDTERLLEWALERLGLNRREANEFIVYWLPQMQNNRYNLITFNTSEYADAAELKVNPQPDTLIRVFMTYRPSDRYIKLPPDRLSAPERQGFTVVEWGGTEVK